MDKKILEESDIFTPRFDEKGLIPCITTCAQSGEVLMFAFMNEDALLMTIQSSEAHYWSRSRQSLWHKGATSGFTQKVTAMHTDCDQDCIRLSVIVQHPEGTKPETCHTGRRTCFYRSVDLSVAVETLDGIRLQGCKNT